MNVALLLDMARRLLALLPEVVESNRELARELRLHREARGG